MRYSEFQSQLDCGHYYSTKVEEGTYHRGDGYYHWLHEKDTKDMDYGEKHDYEEKIKKDSSLSKYPFKEDWFYVGTFLGDNENFKCEGIDSEFYNENNSHFIQLENYQYLSKEYPINFDNNRDTDSLIKYYFNKHIDTLLESKKYVILTLDYENTDVNIQKLISYVLNRFTSSSDYSYDGVDNDFYELLEEQYHVNQNGFFHLRTNDVPDTHNNSTSLHYIIPNSEVIYDGKFPLYKILMGKQYNDVIYRKEEFNGGSSQDFHYDKVGLMYLPFEVNYDKDEDDSYITTKKLLDDYKDNIVRVNISPKEVYERLSQKVIQTLNEIDTPMISNKNYEVGLDGISTLRITDEFKDKELVVNYDDEVDDNTKVKMVMDNIDTSIDETKSSVKEYQKKTKQHIEDLMKEIKSVSKKVDESVDDVMNTLDGIEVKSNIEELTDTTIQRKINSLQKGNHSLGDSNGIFQTVLTNMDYETISRLRKSKVRNLKMIFNGSTLYKDEKGLVLHNRDNSRWSSNKPKYKGLDYLTTELGREYYLDLENCYDSILNGNSNFRTHCERNILELIKNGIEDLISNTKDKSLKDTFKKDIKNLNYYLNTSEYYDNHNVVFPRIQQIQKNKIRFGSVFRIFFNTWLKETEKRLTDVVPNEKEYEFQRDKYNPNQVFGDETYKEKDSWDNERICRKPIKWYWSSSENFIQHPMIGDPDSWNEFLKREKSYF